MTVFKTKIFNNESCGASLIEVVLAISIIAIAAPFMYRQIQSTYSDVENISLAQKITDLQDNVLNFVRTNQENWPDEAEIVLTPDDIQAISPMISNWIIDKRQFRGSSVTDVYLAFDVIGFCPVKSWRTFIAFVNLSPDVPTLIFKISLSMTISRILFMAFLALSSFFDIFLL